MIRIFRRANHTAAAAASIRSVFDHCMKYVPEHGFEKALTLGIRDKGYSDAAHSTLTTMGLVKHHLVTSKEQLNTIELPEKGSSYDKLEHLLVKRLEMNHAINPRLGEALSIMTQPKNLATSLEQLHELSDEMWWLSNDRTSDFSWYTKRAALSSVYASSEMFMVQDQSTNYRETMDFARHYLRKAQATGYASDNTMEWLKFNTIASFNVLKSLTRG